MSPNIAPYPILSQFLFIWAVIVFSFNGPIILLGYSILPLSFVFHFLAPKLPRLPNLVFFRFKASCLPSCHLATSATFLIFVHLHFRLHPNLLFPVFVGVPSPFSRFVGVSSPFRFVGVPSPFFPFCASFVSFSPYPTPVPALPHPQSSF